SAAVCREDRFVSWENGVEAAKERFAFVLVRQSIAQKEIGDQIQVWFTAHIRMCEERLDLRSEDERPAVRPIVERPAPDGIAREHQSFAGSEECCDCEIARDPMEARLTPRAKCLEDHFRV